MAFDGEGTIYVPLEDFHEFLSKYAPYHRDGVIVFGVPVMHKGGDELEVSYAVSTTEVSPKDWSKKPQAVKELEELK